MRCDKLAKLGKFKNLYVSNSINACKIKAHKICGKNLHVDESNVRESNVETLKAEKIFAKYLDLEKSDVRESNVDKSNIKELNLLCDEKYIPVNGLICNLYESDKWMYISSVFSWEIINDEEPFTPFGANVLEIDPRSTLPTEMYDLDTGVFTTPETGVYSLNLNVTWFGLDKITSPFPPTDGTLVGNYTSRWNTPAKNGIKGNTIYESTLSQNQPREEFQETSYSTINFIVVLKAGEKFNPELYASFNFVPANGGKSRFGFLYAITQMSIYLLNKIPGDEPFVYAPKLGEPVLAPLEKIQPIN